jgi:hypothetical protein
MGAQAPIRHLADESLVHHVHMDRRIKDFSREFNRVDLFSFNIQYICFHSLSLPAVNSSALL